MKARIAIPLCWLIVLLLSRGRLDAATEPVYFLRKVTALGGHPVRGVEHGVLFEQRPGEDCSLPGPTPAKLLAASLGRDVRLAVEIGACPEQAPVPEVDCFLQVGDSVAEEQFTGEERFTGWGRALHLPLPSRTGIYPVSLRCTLRNQTAEIGATLYLIYAPPRSPVMPPPQEWYALAGEWGAGFTAGDPEASVLEAILRRLYDHGQRFWRYGYCTVDAATGRCSFGDSSIPVGSPRLHCFPGAGICRCRWPWVAGDDAQCNFTDCFGYASMFHYIAATMGIGGLLDERVQGSHQKGFGVNAWLRSLDPEALGNLFCGYRDLPCAFLFGQHDLRRRDRVLYDPTFGSTYHDLRGLIASDILQVVSGMVVLQGKRACLTALPPYGGFSQFRELPPHLLACPRAEDGPVVFPPLDPVLSATAIELRLTEGDARPEQVGVRLPVEIRRAGEYTVLGVLLGGTGGDQLVAARPSSDVIEFGSPAKIAGPPGLYEVTLWFSGEDLTRSGVPGPYRVSAIVLAPDGIAGEILQELPAVRFDGLGERPARLGRLTAEKVDLPGRAPVLRTRARLTVRSSGQFAVDARLFSEGRTLTYAGLRRELSQGDNEVDLDFPGEEIARRGIDGVYTVTVELHALDPVSLEPLGLLDSMEEDIGSFKAPDFRPPGP